MDPSRYGSSAGRSSSTNPTGFYHGTVKAVDGDTVTVQVPRLFGGANIPGVPVAGTGLAVNDPVFVSFIEGRRGSLLAFASSGAAAVGDITSVTAGTNLNGGGTSGGVTVNLDDDITLTSVTGNLYGPVHITVKNTSGGTLAKGSAVYATGSVGASGAVEVQASDNTDPATMPALGLLDSELTSNAVGSATIFGVIRQADTSGYAINDELWINGSGTLQNTRPASGLVQKIGRVVRVHASTGEILVMGAGRTNDVPNGTLANDISGNAATATALETARTIGGVSFNGTGNINLPGVNTAGNQDTSGNAATATLAADSSLLGGLGLKSSSGTPSGSQVIQSHTNGYTYLGWINTTSGSTTSTISRIYASNDQFVRYVTPATFRSQIINGQTISPSRITAANGSASAPSLSFSGDSNTGFYSTGNTGVIYWSGNNNTGGYLFNSGIRTDNGTGATPSHSFTGDTNTGMYLVGSDRLGFTTGGGARMYIQNNSTGLTGSSSRSLSVKASGAIEMYRTATGANDGILALYSNNGSTGDLQWLVYGDGDTASDTGSYGTISDNRLKTNIVAYKDPTDDLMAINVIKYDLSKTSTGIDDNGDPIIQDRETATTMTGWEAQQVQSVKPGFVKLDAERGILSVKSSVFVPLLHRGFQIHEERIQALQAENDDLRTRIEALEAQ